MSHVIRVLNTDCFHFPEQFDAYIVFQAIFTVNLKFVLLKPDTQ